MKSFTDLTLNPLLARGITDMGFETPTEVQAQTLPLLLGKNCDFIGLAATGTGKTVAFAIPLIEKIDTELREVQGLILCPTRELVIQVAGQINLLCRHMGIKALPVYGGASYGDQIRGLKQGAMIVVGTPGRLIDHMDRGTLNLDSAHTIILDEADEMISMGFKDDLEKILSETNEEGSQIWLFSATMSREVRKVADTYLNSPEQVHVNRTEMLSSTVEQIYYFAAESNKPEVLGKLIDAADDFYGLVFCQTKVMVANVTEFLKDRGLKVDCLHGDKDQSAREKTMRDFRDRKVNMLVCTDVASRGLDVKDITHVINYSIPRELDSYVHRIGRTARSGKTGFAFSLVSQSQRSLIRRIEQMTQSKMKEGKIPTRKDVGMKKVAAVRARFVEQTGYTKAIDLLDAEWKTLIASMSLEEITGRFVSLMFPEIFNDRTPEAATNYPTPTGIAAGIVIRSRDENEEERGNDRGGYHRGGRDSRGGPSRFGSSDERGNRRSFGGDSAGRPRYNDRRYS